MSLARNKTASAIGVIDLRVGKMTTVIPEGSSPSAILLGMKWDPITKRLLGVLGQQGDIELHQVDPSTGKWSRTMLAGFDAVVGNDGSVSAFDAKSGTLYVLMTKDNPGGSQELHLVSVYVRQGAIGIPAPVLATVGLGVTLQLTFRPTTK